MAQARRTDHTGSRDPSGTTSPERLSSLGILVATLAHEINNPLAYLLGNLAELRTLSTAMQETIARYRRALVRLAGPEAPELSADVESKLAATAGMEALDEILADAEEGGCRIRDVVRDLLVLAKEPERSGERIDINEALSSAIHLARKPLAACAELVQQLDATTPIEADRTKLGRLLLNLLLNAIAACDSGDRAQHRITVRSFDTRDGVCVEIEDSGGGIPEAIQEQVFAPFFTTRGEQSGTGLGLFTARQIVDEHGGEMGFRQAQAEGTVFWVALPRNRCQSGGGDPDSR